MAALEPRGCADHAIGSVHRRSPPAACAEESPQAACVEGKSTSMTIWDSTSEDGLQLSSKAAWQLPRQLLGRRYPQRKAGSCCSIHTPSHTPQTSTSRDPARWTTWCLCPHSLQWRVPRASTRKHDSQVMTVR